MYQVVVPNQDVLCITSSILYVISPPIRAGIYFSKTVPEMTS